MYHLQRFLFAKIALRNKMCISASRNYGSAWISDSPIVFGCADELALMSVTGAVDLKILKIKA